MFCGVHVKGFTEVQIKDIYSPSKDVALLHPRRPLDWILGNTSSLRVLLNIGTEEVVESPTLKVFKTNVETEAWFSGENGSADYVVELYDLRGLF